MSITNVYIIPKNESYKPSKAEFEEIKKIMNSESFRNLIVSYDTNNEIQFYDCGENFEKISCPLCNSELDTEWWQEEMGKASDDNFESLDIKTPCCHANSSLNKLDYSYAQGFSKFAIVIEDYDFTKGDNFPTSELQSVSKEEWKIIFSRY